MTKNNNHYRKKDSARLVWDSKPKRAANPKDIEFQTAEIVIPNPEKTGQLPLSFKDGLFGEKEIDKQKMNRLIWGDNLLAMQALLAQGYEGKINLIYIDPPFDSKADYSQKIRIEGEEVTKEPSVIERLVYKDTWAGGTDSYLDMLYPRLQLMKRLLADDGSIYVHLDWHVGHYVRAMLDEVFGKENFVNEIVWKKYSGVKNQASKKFTTQTDSIFLYSKTGNHIFNQPFREMSKEYIKQEYKYVDEKGKRYALLRGRGYQQSGEHKRKYLEEAKGAPITTLWDDDNLQLNTSSSERLDFDTQKPEALLIRILETGSNENDLIADFFAGSGTTFSVAEKLNRRWIGCELGKVGIQVARARLVEQEARPFLIENIGNYQREMIYLSGGRIYEMQKIILKLYGATPKEDRQDLGARKADDEVLELVYVGYPDRPVTARKAVELAKEAEGFDGTGYKRLVILAWDYEYNYSELLEQRLTAEKPKTKIESRAIPPDIYEYLKKIKDEDDIEPLKDKVQFFEKPYLKMKEPKIKDNEVAVEIDKYVVFDFPVSKEEEREKLMWIAKDNFAALIDYWAVDWDYDGYTFRSQWQDFRGLGRKTKVVTTKISNKLEKGKRKIAVRLVDIFGNDATTVMEVKI